MDTKQRPSQRPQMTLRFDMDEQLDRLTEASGLTKVEIVARALAFYEPRLLQACAVLNATEEQPTAAHAGAV